VLNWTLAKLKREGLSSNKAPERLDYIGRTADRLFDLMAELVRIYDVQVGDEQPQGADSEMTESDRTLVWDARNILAEAIRLQEPFAEAKGGGIEVEMPSYPLAVKAAQLQLSRVFDNIIRNAFLHNGDQTRLEVSGRQRGNMNQIVFADNGKGIAPAHLQQIFDAGFSTSKETGENEGLGLSIVKSIVESLGGTISVDSEEDIGTTFTISLPIAEGSIHDSVVIPMRSSKKA
jgi:signal transduction histidine kinase